MLKEYRTYFLLVTKYNLIYESVRFSVAENCYCIEKSGVVERGVYNINNRKIPSKDVVVLANIFKDIEKLNDFCTSYYPANYQLKIKDRKKIKEAFYQVLNRNSFKQVILKINNYNSSIQELVEQLEEYREYYATDIEKEKYDEIRRKENSTYRLVEPLLGKMIIQEIFSSTYQDTFDKWCQKQGNSSVKVNRYIDAYLEYFASKDEIERYQNLKNNIALLKREQEKKDDSYREKVVKEYLKWLNDPKNQTRGYAARYSIESGYEVRYIKVMLSALKEAPYSSSKALYQEYLTVVKKVRQKIEQDEQAAIEELTKILKEGVYLEEEQRYRKMNVLDYLSKLPYTPEVLCCIINQQHYDRETYLLWKEFIKNEIGMMNDYHYYVEQFFTTSLEAILLSEKDVLDVFIASMEQCFETPLTKEEKLQTYRELRKIYRYIPVRLLYSVLKAKHGYFEYMDEIKKVKKKGTLS